MSEAFFRDALDALVGFLPVELAAFEHRVHSRGLKVWFGDAAKEHYEAQLVGRYVDGADTDQVGAAIEIGFHAEYGDPARNARVVEALLTQQKAWRKRLGSEAVVGYFVGDTSQTWQRISEFWTGPEIEEADTAIEAADRLASYIAALEPVRTAGGSRPAPRRSAAGR